MEFSTPKRKANSTDKSFSPQKKLRRKLKFADKDTVQVGKDSVGRLKSYDEILPRLRNLDVPIMCTYSIWRSEDNELKNRIQPYSDISVLRKGYLYHLKSGSNMFPGNLSNRQVTNKGFDNVGYVLVMVEENCFAKMFSAMLNVERATQDEMRNFNYQLSVLTKCIKRGRTLSSLSLLRSTIKCLESVNLKSNGKSFQSVLVWKILSTIFSDIRPFVTSDGNCLNQTGLLSIGILLDINPKIVMTSVLQEKLRRTIMLMHQTDSHHHCIPWLGWRLKYRDDFFKNIVFEEYSANVYTELVELLKVLILFDWPLLSIEKSMFKRYLIGISNDEHFSLPRLAISPEISSFSRFDNEIVLAAHDQTVFPVLLLLVQAFLPFVPSNKEQHSCRALSRLIERLSSNVNVRNVKRQLLGIETGELFRLQQYLGNLEDEKSENDSLDIEVREKNLVEFLQAKESLGDTINKTEHEKILSSVIQECQLLLAESFNILICRTSMSKSESSEIASGSEPIDNRITANERRVAFLQIFGRELTFKHRNQVYVSVLCGDKARPFLIKLKRSGKSKRESSLYIPVDSELYEELVTLSISNFLSQDNNKKLCDPPFGLRWKIREPIEPVILPGEAIKDMRFFVNNIEVGIFDVGNLLHSCRVPLNVHKLPRFLKEFVEIWLYISKSNGIKHSECYIQLNSSTYLSSEEVYDWVPIAIQSPLPIEVWQDLLLKISMRIGRNIAFSTTKDGTRKALNNEGEFEGCTLRICMLLERLYQGVLTVKLATNQKVVFEVVSVQCAQYCHLIESLRTLCVVRKVTNVYALVGHTMPTIVTHLWKHQQEAVDMVLKGINNGKKGFADASAVGSGKTLTSIAVIAATYRLSKTENRGGNLVLLPSKSLIDEWVFQVMVHTKGFHVLVQNSQGVLKSKGISNSTGKVTRPDLFASRVSCATAARNDERLTPTFGPFSKIDSNCIIITTLNRARNHEFMITKWNFVIVDECLSVQSPAMTSIYAWKNAIKSEYGVLMLSATFFRSKMRSLFYMIRMLRSGMPEKEEYLQTILNEHVVVYVPESPRQWKITFISAELDSDAYAKYKGILNGNDKYTNKFIKLKQLLKIVYEQSVYIEKLKKVVSNLGARGRRVIIFARTKDEKQRILKEVDNTISLAVYRKTSSTVHYLVVTIHEGAQGLNLQNFNTIVSRPQPGDILEQMKGRVDRSGQIDLRLELCVLIAKGTIEEIEAANIRLCGKFFRQYLDPLSKTFKNRAIEAFLQSSKKTSRKSCNPTDYISPAADKFRKLLQVEDIEISDNGHISTQAPTKTELSVHVSATQPTKRCEKSTKRAKVKKIRRKRLSPTVFLSENANCLDNRILEQGLKHLVLDPKLNAVIQQVGPPTALLHRIGKQDPFKALAKSMAYQQLSTKAAASIFRRFETLCGGPNCVAPQRVLELSSTAIRGCGFSSRKVEYVQSLSKHFMETHLTRDDLLGMSDTEVRENLIKVKGLGDWSIHMFLMFSLGRVDVFPVGDLVVRKACKRLYGLNSGDSSHDTKVSNLPDAHELLEISKQWRPYRSIATWLLWHSVESEVCNFVY